MEEGGETSFTELGIKVKPKRGRALIWPLTQDSNPNKMDIRMFHEALPVIKGVKLSANLWIRLYDFETPHNWRCSNTLTTIWELDDLNDWDIYLSEKYLRNIFVEILEMMNLM